VQKHKESAVATILVLLATRDRSTAVIRIQTKLAQTVEPWVDIAENAQAYSGKLRRVLRVLR
jgi:hypothetical protein